MLCRESQVLGKVLGHSSVVLDASCSSEKGVHICAHLPVIFFHDGHIEFLLVLFHAFPINVFLLQHIHHIQDIETSSLSVITES